MPNFEITTEQFETLIFERNSFVLHFWADWNGYDVEQKKIIDSVKIKYPTIKFLDMNVDREENFDICKNHKIRELPTIVFYSQGFMIMRLDGFVDEKKLNTDIQFYFNS